MGEVNFLNLEYLFTRIFRFFGDADQALGVSSGTLPDWFAVTIQTIIVLGMLLSLVLLILIVYTQIRLVQVEHAGFHTLHEREEAAAGGEEAEAASGKNERWVHIIELSTSPSESDWRRAILEADIMLGEVLAEQGYPGVSVGEQLRHANPLQMTTLDLAWKAHKVRNDIAHGGDGFELTERDVRSTIDYYKRVFDEFGAI